MVISPSLRHRIEALSAERGDRYRELRAALSGEVPSHRAEIASLAEDESAPWPPRFTARALLLAADDPALHRDVERWARGEFRLGPGTPIAGAPDPRSRAGRIAASGPRGLPRVIELLWNERDRLDDGGVLALVLAVRDLGGEEAVPLLAALVEEGSPTPATAAAEALGRMGRPSALPSLLASLGSPEVDVQVRSAAALAIGQLRAPEAAPLLAAIFADPATPADLRVSVVIPYSRLAGPSAVAPILARLSAEDDDRTVQRMADALADTRSPSAIAPLQRLASEHPNPFVRQAAEGALELLRRRLSP